jgi:hypothetical protein
VKRVHLEWAVLSYSATWLGPGCWGAVFCTMQCAAEQGVMCSAVQCAADAAGRVVSVPSEFQC